MRNIRLLLLLAVLVVLSSIAKGQKYPGIDSINVCGFYDELLLSENNYQLAFTDKPAVDIQTPVNLPFNSPGTKLDREGKITDNLNAKHVFLKFILHNPSDSAEKLCIYPGYYFKSIHIYRQAAGMPKDRLEAIPDQKPAVAGGNAYRIISLQAGETSIFYVQLQPVKIRTNRVNPVLIRMNYLTTHALLVDKDDSMLVIITYMLVGVMCMMLLFSLGSFILYRKKEFLFYCMYAGLVAFLLFFKTYLYRSASDFTYFFEEFFDFLIMLTAMICYAGFLRYFLSTSRKYPLLDRLITGIEAVIIGFLLIYSSIYFFSGNVVFREVTENVMKCIVIAWGVVFIILAIKTNDKLINFLVGGNLVMIIAGAVSLLFIVRNDPSESVFTSALFYYDIGIVTELAFFLVGLTYKTRSELIERIKIEDRRKMESDKKEFEKQLTIFQTQQEERNRISADMHDELGGGMTAIRLMSELAKQRAPGSLLPEIEKISGSANDLLGKMNAIIWSMSPANDTLPNLVAYIRSYAYDFFENTDVHCTIEVEDDIPAIIVSGIKRRNIFLAVKEALNNIVKHANATTVKINIDFEKTLLIIIKDDGRGMDKEKNNRFGNGLSNMRRRMEAIGGSFSISSQGGTTISLQAGL
ncbi:MAG: sensor histidine kinase [Chitinophagaceae bacterium]|nr:sensor histidine kinase [Chitinophagaceae bacterium]